MNKNAVKEKLEQGQIIVDYVNNHLTLAWNELTLINQAIDQTKKALNATLIHVAPLAAATDFMRRTSKDMRKVIFAIPDVVDGQVFFDETYVASVSAQVAAGDRVYVLSPSVRRDFADAFVKEVAARKGELVFLNFMMNPAEAELLTMSEFIFEHLHALSALVFSVINAYGEMQRTAFYVAQSHLISTNYTFRVFPLQEEERLEDTNSSSMLSDRSDEIEGRAFVPNEAVATRNAIVFAIARRWALTLLDDQKNATLRRIVQWQDTLDRQIVENKRLMQRYRGIKVDEDIQELSVLNSEGP